MAELLGTFEQLILLAVLGLDEEAYGRAVLRAVQDVSRENRSISAGAVYATLDRVEAKGLLSSRIEKGTPARGGRARRFYRLTQSGASALSDARQTLEKMWHGKRWPPEVTA
jgi:PadR family transcriptional regulator PadR